MRLFLLYFSSVVFVYFISFCIFEIGVHSRWVCGWAVSDERPYLAPTCLDELIEANYKGREEKRKFWGDKYKISCVYLYVFVNGCLWLTGGIDKSQEYRCKEEDKKADNNVHIFWVPAKLNRNLKKNWPIWNMRRMRQLFIRSIVSF